MVIKKENFITKLNRKIAENFSSWLIYPLIFVMVLEVFSRYFFSKPTFFAYDLTWMLYSALALLGGAYALIEGSHVKADIIYENLSDKKKAIIDIICSLVLFFPGMIGLTISSWNLLYKAIIYNEKTIFTNWAPSAIPSRIFLLIGAVLLTVQGLVQFLGAINNLLQKGSDKE